MSNALARRVEEWMERHAMAGDGTRLLALVSGGADSTCLMHLLAEIRPGRVGVLTMDHGLRDAAAGEVASVVEHAQALGLPVWVERLAIAPGAGLQERARDARMLAARRIARQHRFDRIATGHTASDQAETVLFRLARGTGRTGAMGMAPIAGDVVRPLLCASADETRRWCVERGLDVVEDPSNRDGRFARARVRGGLLPALDQIHPGADLAVARFAEQLRDESELLDVMVDAAWARCRSGDGLAASAIATEHPALARLVLRRLAADAGVPLDATWIARVVDLAHAGGRTLQVPGGIVAVDRGVLVVEPAVSAELPQPVELSIPGEVRFGDRLIRARRASAGAPSARRVAVAIDGPLIVRSPGPGDRVPLPGGGRQAVGRLLAAAGVPARHRPRVPVVACGGHVVWVGGYRADPNLLAAPDAPATVLEVIDA